MSETKRNVPKLRFPGFTEDWEQRKLGEISEKVLEKNQNMQYRETFTNSAELGIISQTDFFDKEISNKENISGYYVVRENDFIYNPRISNLAPVGPINRNKLNKTGVMSPLYTIFNVKNIDLDFLENFFQSKHWHKYMKLNGDSGARADRIAIKDAVFFEMPILIPKNIHEQILIGKTINNFNKYITLHQRKLENLKLKKKALLQKLFPKNGEQFPELRFPGFTDAWEQRKLGEVATVTGGGTPSTNISEYWNGDIDWYSPVEIGENRYVSGSIRKITKLGLEKSSAKILPVGTVLFTSRAGIGNTAILQVEGCTNQGFQSITPNLNELDTYFLYTMTPKLKRYGEIIGAGSTFVEVSGKQMEQMNLMVPSLEEQKRVSELFKTMDDAITLHQRKLEHLQLQKKALLQQMFV